MLRSNTRSPLASGWLLSAGIEVVSGIGSAASCRAIPATACGGSCRVTGITVTTVCKGSSMLAARLAGIAVPGIARRSGIALRSRPVFFASRTPEPGCTAGYGAAGDSDSGKVVGAPPLVRSGIASGIAATPGACLPACSAGIAAGIATVSRRGASLSLSFQTRPTVTSRASSTMGSKRLIPAQPPCGPSSLRSIAAHASSSKGGSYCPADFLNRRSSSSSDILFAFIDFASL